MNMPQGWSFDARTVAPTNAFGQGTVPEGWYKVVIRKSNIKPTNDGLSGRLELQCEVIEGQLLGRVVFWNLNIFNQSQQAVEIAYKQLSALCAVLGQFQVSAQPGQDNAVPMLHNQPFYIFVVIGAGNKGPINNVQGLKDINGNEPGKSGGAPMQQPAPPNVGPAPGSGAPQWGAPPQGAPQGQPTWGAPGGPQPPSQVSAPGGWGGQPAAPPAGGPAPGGWQSGPAAPGPAPQGGPAPQQWGGGAPSGPAPAGQPQWGPPPQQQPGPPAGAPTWGGPPQGQPTGQPQQQWAPQPGQPAGGPPQGAAPWGPRQ